MAAQTPRRANPSKAMIMRRFVYANSLGVQPGTRHEGRIEIDCSNVGSELSGPENSPAHPWDDRPDARAVKSGFAKLAPLGRLAHPAEIASAALFLAGGRQLRDRCRAFCRWKHRAGLNSTWAEPRRERTCSTTRSLQPSPRPEPGGRLPMALTRPDPSCRSPTRQR